MEIICTHDSVYIIIFLFCLYCLHLIINPSMEHWLFHDCHESYIYLSNQQRDSVNILISIMLITTMYVIQLVLIFFRCFRLNAEEKTKTSFYHRCDFFIEMSISASFEHFNTKPLTRQINKKAFYFLSFIPIF